MPEISLTQSVNDVGLFPNMSLSAQALCEFCQITDGVDELLQSEFGGYLTFAGAMSSTKLH